MTRLVAALALVAALTLPARAGAQSASYGQYLVVIDDSGSMDGSDPRRLAQLASLALAASLEDGDQVMLVGLNELATDSGSARFVSPRELLPERAAESEHAIGGERAQRLAQHEGQTPCRAALDRARAILEAAASSGAPQTLLMLTDGACNGGAVEPAERWLSSLRAHREGRFRFVLLMRQGPERVDRVLEAYGRQTGWQGDTRIAFDARALLRAFADVLSFSRGLRWGEGGRVGLERTFAGARAVRVLAIRDRGEGPIALEQVDAAGRSAPVRGGATYREPTHGWSFRSATVSPADTPFAVRSASPGVDVLVIPVYGRLRVEAVVAPCEREAPPSFAAEVAVRAGQPACAFARLVGDTGETIVPGRSLEFGIELCETADCVSPSPMQPGPEGVFHAQLGTELARGRHERTFRARGGALAAPVVATRGFAAVSFGVQRVTRDGAPVSSIDLGELPRPMSEDLVLRYEGSFPAGSRARVRCEIEGGDALAACIECALPEGDELTLQDAFEVHAVVRGRAFCPRASEGGGEPRPVRLRLILAPRVLEPAARDTVGAHSLPIDATLRYAPVAPLALELTAGDAITRELVMPGPVAETTVEASAAAGDDDLSITGEPPRREITAAADRTMRWTFRAEASACCGEGERDARVRLHAGDGSELEVPVRVSIRAPSFWVCPGQQIAMAIAALLAIALLGWIVHGIVSPARFAPGALLLSASSLDELTGLREGDDGWRPLRRFAEAKRGFRRPAAIWLGGPRAPLPSLRRQPLDGRIEAQPGGGATLIVTGPGVERWSDAEGRFVEAAPGTYPVPSRVRIKRGDELFLEFRR